MTSYYCICAECKHFWAFDASMLSCDAFMWPEKIPGGILYRGQRHDQPLPGQKTLIIFEPGPPRMKPPAEWFEKEAGR